MTELIFNTSAADFEERVIKHSFSTPVLVDFWADWCQPCKQLYPILESLIEKYQGRLALAKVNTDQEQNLAMGFGIRSLPTVVLFKNGEMVGQFTGVQPQAEIESMISPHLGNEEAVTPQGEHHMIEQLIASGRKDKAIEYLQADESLAAKELLIKLLISENRYEEARSAFTHLKKQNDEDLASLQSLIQLAEMEEKCTLSELKSILRQILKEDPSQGIESLLLLLQNTDKDQLDPIKQALILSFGLIDDAKIVSSFRRKMAAIIF